MYGGTFARSYNDSYSVSIFSGICGLEAHTARHNPSRGSLHNRPQGALKFGNVRPECCTEFSRLTPRIFSGYFREAPVRFGSVTVWGWNGSSGSGFRFRRFLCKKGFSVFQCIFKGKDGSGSGFGSWKTVPAVPVPLSVSGKTVPTVLVSGSGSVPEPPCYF